MVLLGEKKKLLHEKHISKYFFILLIEIDICIL